VKLVWWEEHDSREKAMSREWHIKQMTRAEKERLIRGEEEQCET
jgi:putative endonuclease